MLIQTKKVYICPYRHCNKAHSSLEEAEECLDSHNVIFLIEEKGCTIDCWGRPEIDWVATDLIYKNYKDVKYYGESPDFRVVIKELL